MLTLISATPSPFARMNRIAMHEKKIEFKLENEVPWNSSTQTPQHNPLEKLPILLFDDGRAPVYDSSHIQEYIVQKYADQAPSLLTGDLDLDLQCRQIQVLGQGLLDAFVLVFWENKRDQAQQSEAWLARQNRKIDGAMKAYEDLTKNKKGDYLVGGVLTIADIAVVCSVDQVDFAQIRENWRSDYPELSKYMDKMNSRDGWNETKPQMFELEDNIV